MTEKITRRSIGRCSICNRKIDLYNEIHYSIDLNEIQPGKANDGTPLDTILTNTTLTYLCKKCVIIKNMFNAIIPEHDKKRYT